MLQFKATVWPKVASESTYEAQKFQNFLGGHPPDPPSCFCIPYCKRLKAGRCLGTRLLANIVCPHCALASAVFWLLHWFSVMLYASEKVSTLCIVLICKSKNKNGGDLHGNEVRDYVQSPCNITWLRSVQSGS